MKCLEQLQKLIYAEKMNIDPEKMVVVSVMPCLAKKYEAARPELEHEWNYKMLILL